ncbi:carbonic anhydrase 2-like [Dreissena polymorpha]|uniref:Carbonic anhydrase n=1 Tax=Dreissena polymorpha TaxID=45954 RepID=A0A9D3Y391_DREPO|nr:carbonic anhydrase 2-like [Dreissena polymorpha]KAH3691125.1 hypothetical protein DPMN_194085 [Dreissena polymorpha]
MYECPNPTIRVVDSASIALLCGVFVLFLRSSDSDTVYEFSDVKYFHYDRNVDDPYGVYNWPKTFSRECNGQQQSPVNIETGSLSVDEFASCPTMVYNSPVVQGTLINNGHSAEFLFYPGDLAAYNIPHRYGMYIAHDFHVHYGGLFESTTFDNQISPGSEHTVNGYRYDGELHIVMYNSRYGSIEEAEHHADGLAVLAFFIHKQPDSLDFGNRNMHFSIFLGSNLPYIANINFSISTSLNLDVFRRQPCEFYTYSGSTTTPLCNQAVQWVIFREPLLVSRSAWSAIQLLEFTGDYDNRYGNFRVLQPLNGRVVESNFVPTF